jgi:hypothetical protein
MAEAITMHGVEDRDIITAGGIIAAKRLAVGFEGRSR